MLTAWLGGTPRHPASHLALDGKRIREHPHTIVTFCDFQEQGPVAVRTTVENCGDFLISLKDNQPTLTALATAQLAGTPFFVSALEVRSGELRIILHQCLA